MSFVDILKLLKIQNNTWSFLCLIQGVQNKMRLQRRHGDFYQTFYKELKDLNLK